MRLPIGSLLKCPQQLRLDSVKPGGWNSPLLFLSLGPISRKLDQKRVARTQISTSILCSGGNAARKQVLDDTTQNSNSRGPPRSAPRAARRERGARGQSRAPRQGCVLRAPLPGPRGSSRLVTAAPPPGVSVTRGLVNRELPAPACPAGPSDRRRCLFAHGRWGFFRLFS